MDIGQGFSNTVVPADFRTAPLGVPVQQHRACRGRYRPDAMRVKPGQNARTFVTGNAAKTGQAKALCARENAVTGQRPAPRGGISLQNGSRHPSPDGAQSLHA